MVTLLMLLLPLFVTLVFAKTVSTYDSRIHKGKYVVIRNKTIARLLISKCTPPVRGKQTLKKDRNKMSLFGLVIYLGTLFVILITVILLIIPKVPCEPFLVDSTRLFLYADTINAKIPICLSLSLFALASVFWFVYWIRLISDTECKWIKIAISIFFGLMIVVCAIGAFMLLIEAFKW